MKKLIKSVSGYIKNHPKTDLAILFIGLAVFITIAIINAPRAAIWFDEAFSAYIAQFSFWDIARYTASDVHPPFYYWLLKVWTSVFGTTELGYRSLSILFGAATTVVAFFLSRKLFGRKVAWLSLVFLALSPMLIRYSDEARMYTLVSLIVMSATYILVKAEETNQRKYWIWYGVLVSLGMWTHYFSALAWLAHLAWHGAQVWHKGIKLKEFRKKLFAKPWVITYAVAIGLFIPWLPFMVFQLGVVQGSGFWIGKVGAYTPANYLTNYFYYLENGEVVSWVALALIVIVVLSIAVLPKVYKALNKKEKRSFLLISALAWVPPVLLFMASLPPLRSSFVDRYLVPSTVALSIFLAVLLIKGTQKWHPLWRTLPVVIVVGMMIFGITNVYKYGNYNKNTNVHILTREAVTAAQAASPAGTPIIAESPWVFYEAVPYSTADHPVYFIDENTKYIYGSLDMLKDNDLHKIKDMAAFEKEHPTIWYLGYSDNADIAPYRTSWKKIETVGEKDNITGKYVYKATAYKVSGE
ncbi:MAG: glycosyltransferase family 39 protein [Candidatus Saccharimonadaceae bacterium]